MSMPSFPPNGADLTQEEALTMIIASIAMERGRREAAIHFGRSAGGKSLRHAPGCAGGKQERSFPSGCSGTEPDAVEKQTRESAGGLPASSPSSAVQTEAMS